MSDLVLNSLRDDSLPLFGILGGHEKSRITGVFLGEPAHQRGANAILRCDLIVRLIFLGALTHDLGLLLQR